MSILLMIFATGWTVIYTDLELDENGEIYVPLVALVAIAHIMVAALAFIDVDAHHKYHDFAGF